MNKGTFDPAQPLQLYFRCARNGTIDFVFTDANGNPYSLIYEDVEFHVYENEGDKKPIFSLTAGNGISFPSTGRIRASVTIAQTNINEGQKYFELYRPNLGKTWLADYAIFHNGRFDGLQQSESSITVSDSGEEINITITDSSGTSAATQAEVNTGTETAKYVSPATLAAKALKTGTYGLELTFDTDKEIYQDVTTPTFTLAATGNINGVGIILRLNTPTSVTFPANFEAHPNSATLDATKLNYYVLLYHSNWNGTGTERVIYTNSLFTAV